MYQHVKVGLKMLVLILKVYFLQAQLALKFCRQWVVEVLV